MIRFESCSESMSSLRALRNLRVENPIVLQVINKYNKLLLTGKEICFCGLPSHIGIRGNELADSAAKDALQLPVTDFRVPFTDFKCYANKYVANRWQRRWDTLQVTNFTLLIKET